MAKKKAQNSRRNSKSNEPVEETQEAPTEKAEWLKPFRFKPGVSGNPGGRPKGSLKDFARKYFAEMSDEDKLQFLNGIDKDMAWRMAEGNPTQENQVAVEKEGLEKLTEFFRIAGGGASTTKKK